LRLSLQKKTSAKRDRQKKMKTREIKTGVKKDGERHRIGKGRKNARLTKEESHTACIARRSIVCS